MNGELKRKPCPSADKDSQWKSIDFRTAKSHVKKLQTRIWAALAQGELDKAERLMYMLTHSHLAKVFAVQCVCSKNNDAKKLTTCGERLDLALTLSARGYRSDAVVRKAIPKANGGVRMLSIPTVRDRAMQTLYRFALEPVAEFLGDEHSYGFRPGRNTADALCRCLDVLNGDRCPEYVLEGDICRCFDNINRQWIMDNIPIEKKVLRQFLHRMYRHDGKLFPVTEGIPQGACISPMICNMVLDGIEPLLKQHFGDAVQFVRYADDFVVIGHDRQTLERLVIPVLTDFLSVRGLHLSEEKTVITHIDTGFDFLGWHIQRHGRQTIATPSAKNILSLRTKVEGVLFSFWSSRKMMNDKLKSIIKGWVNYHRGVVLPQSLYEVEYDLVMLIMNSFGDKGLAAFVSDLFVL